MKARSSSHRYLITSFYDDSCGFGRMLKVDFPTKGLK